jgi:hypothetical protein
MKKYLLLIMACLSLGSLSARPIYPAYSSVYGELGLGPFPLPLPVFGVGYREQMGHHGWDLSLKASTVVCATHLKGSLIHHYYFNPDLRSQFYMGAGASAGVLFAHHTRPLISPEFVFGKQYLTKSGGLRFFQAQCSFPTLVFNKKHHDSEVFWMPLVVLSYGVMF